MAEYWLLFLFVALTFDRADAIVVIAGLFIGILVEVPFALIQIMSPGSSLTVIGQQSAGVTEALSSGANLSRVAGTLQHPNLLGSYLVLLLPMALLLTLGPSIGRWLRILAFVSLVAGLALLGATLSRGAWTGLVVAVPLALFLAGYLGPLSRLRSTVGLAFTIAAMVVLVALPPVYQRLFESDPNNVAFRFELNAVAIAMWTPNVLGGIGLNTFVENAANFDFAHISKTKVPAHNIYLLWLAETGVIGLIGWVLFLVWSARRSLQLASSSDGFAALVGLGVATGIVALYIGDLFSFSTRIDAIYQGMLILLGLVLALGRTATSDAR
jgi:O-antigen ligase